MKTMLARYGRLALFIYFGIFGLVFAGFYTAIVSGFNPEGVGEGASTLAAAYLATKLTQPLRIGAALLLTPVVDALLRRYRPAKDAPTE